MLDSESLNPTDVQAYTLYEANALVEEFMLLANVTVSKKILRHYPTLSVLRRHPAPNRSMFDGLIQKARTKGISLCIDDSKKLADSLDEAGKKLSDNPYLDKLIRILSTRCMSPAQYFCSGGKSLIVLDRFLASLKHSQYSSLQSIKQRTGITTD